MDQDDLDTLFRRLEPLPPPPGLEARVLGRVARARRRRYIVSRAWVLVDLVALVALAIVGFRFGHSLVAGGALDFALALLADRAAFAEAPADFLLALSLAIPWLEVLGVSAGLIAVAFATRLAFRSEPLPTGAPA
jgi:hypothetical protein